MSTKTLSVMEHLTVGILIPLFLQHLGRLAKVIVHGGLVVAFMEHFFTKHFAYQAGKARVSLRCTDAHPTGDFFIECNGYVFHATIIVQHEFRVKLRSGFSGLINYLFYQTPPFGQCPCLVGVALPSGDGGCFTSEIYFSVPLVFPRMILRAGKRICGNFEV